MQKEQQMQTKPSQPTETVSRPTGIKMALLLFWEFIKLGAFTFGSGWSIIAQMEQEFVDKRHWVEQSDLLELIAVGKSLPGIMVANIVLLFGYQLAGPLGGTAAVIGVLTPTLTLTLVAALFFQKFRESKVMLYIMRAVKPICVGMIFAVLITLSGSTYFAEGISWAGLGIGLLCFWLLRKKKMAIPKVIGIAAVLGLVCFGVL